MNHLRVKRPKCKQIILNVWWPHRENEVNSRTLSMVFKNYWKGTGDELAL